MHTSGLKFSLSENVVLEIERQRTEKSSNYRTNSPCSNFANRIEYYRDFFPCDAFSNIQRSCRDALLDHNEASYWVAAGKTSCLLYTSPSPRDATLSRMPSSA